ncbi:hypothetical protein JCM11491_000671 [Sporobolomyces phaffii]
MPLARQNALKTLPTSDSLPAFTSHQPNRTSSKVSLKVLLSRGIFVAGAGKLQGELEISVKDKALGLGEIGIELNGVEELRNRDHTATKRIVYSRLLFQGPGLPPSNAVVTGSSPSQGGYFPALRGRTRFDFAFDLPKDLPSTSSFGANAVVRYELRAFASSLFEGDVDLKSEKKEVLIVERWDDWRKGNWSSGLAKDAEQELRGREGGLVSVKAEIGKDESSGSLPRLFWWRDVDEGVEGKGLLEVRVRINNRTKRHIPGVKVSLVRRLRLHRDRNREGPAPPQLSTSVASVDFHGSEYDVRAGSEREVLVALQLPKQECWTGRKGTLFDLDCFVRVQVEGGFLEQKLFLELPVWIAHPFSISNTAHRLVDSERQKHNLQIELPPSPSVPFLRSPLSNLDFSSAEGQPHYAQTEVAQPHRLGTSQPQYARSSVSQSSRPYSSPSPQPHYLPPSPQPYTHATAVPYPMPTPQQGYYSFDPALPDLTPSRFLGALQYQQPAQTELQSPTGLSPSPHFYSHQSGVHFPPPPSLVQQAPVPPLDSHPSRQTSPQPPLSVSPGMQPLEPYSAMNRAHHASESPRPAPPLSARPVHTSSAPAAYTPETSMVPPSCPSPAPSTRSQSSRAPLRTPPPPSPSSQYRQTSPSSSIVGISTLQSPDANSLDTIGEDGESQAGTTKSQALTASALAALRGQDEDAGSVRSVKVGNSPGRTSVQDLEELVAEEERRHEESKSSVDSAKALPVLPSPSRHARPDAAVALQQLFIGGAEQGTSSRSSSPSKESTVRPSDGLAALQARLARSTSPLPQTPISPRLPLSRSPSPAKSTALGVPQPATSALRARSLSRSSRRKDPLSEKVLQEAEEDPAEVVKKALSRASWSTSKAAEPTPPPNVSSDVFRAVTAMKSLELGSQGETRVTSEAQGKPLPVKLSEVRVIERPVPSRTSPAPLEKDDLPYRVASPPPSRPPSRPVFGSAASKRDDLPVITPSSFVPPPLDLSSPVEPLKHLPATDEVAQPAEVRALPPVEVNQHGRKVVDTVEVKELKKEAVARVGDWLQSDTRPVRAAASPWSSLSSSKSISTLSQQAPLIKFGRQAPLPPTTIVKVSVPPATTPLPANQPARTEEPTVAQLIAAETRAQLRNIESSSEKPSLVAKGLDGFLAATKRDEEFEPRPYQHSSARGGKGGKVTNVTSIWASREENAARIPVPSPVLGHKSTKSLDFTPSQPLVPVGNAPDRSNRRSLQVLAPASAAKPFLNTTLGRSAPPYSTAASPRTPASPSSRVCLGSENERTRAASGGAKVKDLLARYQQQFA